MSGRYVRGDTIIEAMLAFTVFALLAVGAMTIMNKGVASAQDALETTLVHQQIDAQAEALRFLHQAYAVDPKGSGAAAQFQQIINGAVDNDATKFGDPSCIDNIPGASPFVINVKTGIKSSTLPTAMGNSGAAAPAFSQLIYTPTSFKAYGIWIEAVNGDVGSGPKFIDFHIRACWSSASGDVPRTLGTIVRLYVPAN